jgi:3-hydroxyisobutyrate dehydrogenase
MQSAKVSFVGFGAVASVLSQPMRERGAEVEAYDVLLSEDRGRAILQARARTEGIRFRPLPEAVAHADYVLSTVTTQAAEEVARECVTYLSSGQIYLDLNSTAPSIKAELGWIIEPSGADFVEGAILGAVGATGARTRILVGGAKGREAAEALTELGLNASYYSPEIGKASMFKMLRSIFSKGLEVLILEFLVAARRAGVEQDLWQNVVDFMTGNPFEAVAANWVRSHAVAHERRYHEMVQVAETMREIGVEPVMTAATEAFFRRSLALGFSEVFLQKPDSVEEVIDFMDQRLGKERP